MMNASPAMDTGAPLLVFGAEVELRSSTGSRRVGVADLWTGPGRTSAHGDELCTAIHLPPRPARSGSAYVRLEYRRAMEIAVVGAAASVTLAADGAVVSLSVALTAVAPTIIAVDGTDTFARPSGRRCAAGRDRQPGRRTGSSDQRPAGQRPLPAALRRRDGPASSRRRSRRARGESIAVPVNRSLGIGAAS